jgi:hypothetical protein
MLVTTSNYTHAPDGFPRFRGRGYQPGPSISDLSKTEVILAFREFPELKITDYNDGLGTIEVSCNPPVLHPRANNSFTFRDTAVGWRQALMCWALPDGAYITVDDAMVLFNRQCMPIWARRDDYPDGAPAVRCTPRWVEQTDQFWFYTDCITPWKNKRTLRDMELLLELFYRNDEDGFFRVHKRAMRRMGQ